MILKSDNHCLKVCLNLEANQLWHSSVMSKAAHAEQGPPWSLCSFQTIRVWQLSSLPAPVWGSLSPGCSSFHLQTHVSLTCHPNMELVVYQLYHIPFVFKVGIILLISNQDLTRAFCEQFHRDGSPLCPWPAPHCRVALFYPTCHSLLVVGVPCTKLFAPRRVRASEGVKNLMHSVSDSM